MASKRRKFREPDDVYCYSSQLNNPFTRQKMYKTKFEQWGFAKYNTAKEMKRILNAKFQRDSVGKRSEFVRNGKRVDIQTYLRRKGVSEYDIADFNEAEPELPSYVRCLTPEPQRQIQSPGFLRHQEVLLASLGRVFRFWHRVEMESGQRISWTKAFESSAQLVDQLTYASDLLVQGEIGLGGPLARKAFRTLDQYSRTLGPPATLRLLFQYQQNADPGTTMILWRYLAARLRAQHPLHETFACLYKVLQEDGINSFYDLLVSSAEAAAEQLEQTFGQSHPYVFKFWSDVSFYCRFDKRHRLAHVADAITACVERSTAAGDTSSADALALRALWVRSLATPQHPTPQHVRNIEGIIAQAYLCPPSKESSRLQRDCSYRLFLLHSAACADQPAPFNPRHELARFHLQRYVGLRAGFYGRDDPEANMEARQLERLHEEAGDFVHAAEVRVWREGREAAMLQAAEEEEKTTGGVVLEVVSA